jgi:Mce-associated membrane protein
MRSDSVSVVTRPSPKPAPSSEQAQVRGSGVINAPRSITITLPSLRRRSSRQLRAGVKGNRRYLVGAVGLALVVIALAVTDLVLAGRASDRAAVQTAARDAQRAAETRVPAILSYSYKSLAHDLKAAQTNTTGAFHRDYQKLLSTVVEPSARSKKIVNKATVTGTGVVSGDAKHVVVLVFVTQTTTSASGGTPLVSGSRVNVTMTKTKTHGAWLVSALNPV